VTADVQRAPRVIMTNSCPESATSENRRRRQMVTSVENGDTYRWERGGPRSLTRINSSVATAARTDALLSRQG